MKSKRSGDIERLAYSLKEVAEMLGVSEGHVRNENRRQKLRFTKSARRTLVLATELHRYLAEVTEADQQVVRDFD